MLEVFEMELIRRQIDKYINSTKLEKKKIIDEYIMLTKVKRKTAIKRFNRFIKLDRLSKSKTVVINQGRPIKYTSLEKELFLKIYNLSGNICAERLVAFISSNRDMLFCEFSKQYSYDVINKVVNISYGSAKYLISKIPKPKTRNYRRVNSELYKYISIDAHFGKYARKRPGYFEIDIVEHKDNSSSGIYAITLNFVDLYSQFISRYAGLGKDYTTIKHISDRVINKIPFPIVEMHPDNEKSLLKMIFERYRKKQVIAISSSSSYKKNDNAHIEQKNGNKIRELVGYYRYDSEYEVNLLNQIYEVADLIDNYFVPSFKIKSKLVDEKGRVIKREFEKPKTAYQRIIESEDISDDIKECMKKTFESLNYIKLKKRLNELLDELFDYKLNGKVKLNKKIYELCV